MPGYMHRCPPAHMCAHTHTQVHTDAHTWTPRLQLLDAHFFLNLPTLSRAKCGRTGARPRAGQGRQESVALRLAHPLSPLGYSSLSPGVSSSARLWKPFLSHGRPARYSLHHTIMTLSSGSKDFLSLWHSSPCAASIKTVSPLEAHQGAQVTRRQRWGRSSSLDLLDSPAQSAPHCPSLLPSPFPLRLSRPDTLCSSLREQRRD